MIYTIVFGRRRCIVRETVRSYHDFRQTRLLGRNDSGIHLPTPFVLDLASNTISLNYKGINRVDQSKNLAWNGARSLAAMLSRLGNGISIVSLSRSLTNPLIVRYSLA